MEFGCYDDCLGNVIKSEEYKLLRREIVWLGKTNREIVLLYYYHNMEIAEIAKSLNLPSGTVKWHLSDAKKIMKEGMKKMRDSGNLGIQPVRLYNMGHDGSVGSKGDTGDLLSSILIICYGP